MPDLNMESKGGKENFRSRPLYYWVCSVMYAFFA